MPVPKGLFICQAGPANLADLTCFFRILVWLAYFDKTQLTRIINLIFVETCLTVVPNSLLGTNKNFGDKNQLGYPG